MAVTMVAAAPVPATTASPGRRLVTWGLAAVVLGLGGWALALLVRAADEPGVHDGDVRLQSLRIALALTWGAVGAALALRRPTEGLGPVVMAGAVVSGVAAAASSALLDRPVASAAEIALALSVTLLPAVALHVVVVLPDGRFARRSHRTLVVTGYAAGLACGLLAVAVRPGVPLWLLAGEALVAATAGLAVSNARYPAPAARPASACSGSAWRSPSPPRSCWWRPRCACSSAGRGCWPSSPRRRPCWSRSRSCPVSCKRLLGRVDRLLAPHRVARRPDAASWSPCTS